MNTVRRTVTVLVLTMVVVLVGSISASAAYRDTVTVGQVSVTTPTISAPATVSATKNSCSNARWMGVTVAWQPSTSSRISGYQVTAYRDDGRVYPVDTVGAGTTSVTTTLDKHDGPVTSYTFTVTTTTAYGWTSTESLRSGTVTC
ncbi:fibronectin type III domain-containing protein [Geodermatophilus sp. SYSU D00703]